MACTHRHGTTANLESPCDKCKNAEEKCKLYLKTAVDRYGDRRHDLDCRQRLLGDKIAIMERSIPALIAMGMLRAEDECGKGTDGALERVRELMRELSPLPDPADELVTELTAKVDQLNRETAELHDKIINADVELEETCMELESLELANRELEEQIQCIETKLAAQPSLKSITSDDRVCLARIRHLGEAEIRMKRCIRELEERETALRGQIERILGPSDSKRVCEAAIHHGRGNRHHAHRRRKKEECKILHTSIESIFERDKDCNKISCDALKKMVEQNASMSCKCKKHKTEPPHKKSESCGHLARKCCTRQSRKKSEKSTYSQLCNCYSSPKPNSQKKTDDSLISPWYTPDILSSPIRKIEIKQPTENCENSNNSDDLSACGCPVQKKHSDIQIEVKISRIKMGLHADCPGNQNRQSEYSEEILEL